VNLLLIQKNPALFTMSADAVQREHGADQKKPGAEQEKPWPCSGKPTMSVWIFYA